VWAACSSYLAHNTPPEMRHQAQSVLQGLHHGLGRGVGAVFGGILVASMGTKSTFTLYGVVCLITLGGFWFLNFYRKDAGGFITELPQEEDPHKMLGAEDGAGHLAPHGVPGGSGGAAQGMQRSVTYMQLLRNFESYFYRQLSQLNPVFSCLGNLAKD